MEVNAAIKLCALTLYPLMFVLMLLFNAYKKVLCHLFFILVKNMSHEMNIYMAMLRKAGVPVTDFPIEKVEDDFQPVIGKGPHVRMFTTIPEDDWQRYNDPTACDGPWFALEYNDELLACQKKIHRYSRKDRFRFTLMQLLAMGGDVPIGVIDMVRWKLKTTKPRQLWNHTRAILKANGLRKFYNRIPYILRIVCDLKITNITGAKILSILDKFDTLSYDFDQTLKKKWNRKYFLNMRFVALVLIKRCGITFPYEIPFARTSRKRRYLENLFNDFE